MRYLACTLALGLSLTGSAAYAAAPSTASPAPSASPAATASPGVDDPKMNKIAHEQIDAALTGKLDRSKYSATFNSKVTDDMVTKMSASMAPLGRPSDFKFSKVVARPGESPLYLYEVTWPQITLIEGVGLDKDGKIDVAFFQPKP